MGTCEMLHTSGFSSDVYNVLDRNKRAPVERDRISVKNVTKLKT